MSNAAAAVSESFAPKNNQEEKAPAGSRYFFLVHKDIVEAIQRHCPNAVFVGEPDTNGMIRMFL